MIASSTLNQVLPGNSPTFGITGAAFNSANLPPFSGLSPTLQKKRHLGSGCGEEVWRDEGRGEGEEGGER